MQDKFVILALIILTSCILVIIKMIRRGSLKAYKIRVCAHVLILHYGVGNAWTFLLHISKIA